MAEYRSSLSNNDSTTHIGPLARTVADGALMLSAMAGGDEMDRTSLPDAPADYVGRLREGVRGLRVAFSPDLDTLRVDADVATVVRGGRADLRDAGLRRRGSHDRLRRLPRDDPHDVERPRGRQLRALSREWRDRMDPGLVASIENGSPMASSINIEMRGRKIAYWDSVRPLFERYDLLLTPSLSIAALPVGRLNPESWPQPSKPVGLDRLGVVQLPVQLHRPARGFRTRGLHPVRNAVGLQIVGRRFAD